MGVSLRLRVAFPAVFPKACVCRGILILGFHRYATCFQNKTVFTCSSSTNYQNIIPCLLLLHIESVKFAYTIHLIHSVGQRGEIISREFVNRERKNGNFREFC